MRSQLTLVLLALTCLAAEPVGPERQVEKTAIISTHDPAVRLELPAPARYVGADRFVLYQIADCELHLFVEANDDQKVRRLYWVQFESYLPSRPELHHTYDSPRHATLGGLDFYVDTWVRARDEKSTPGSDGEHVRSLLRSKGYQSPAGMMVVRLVHLMDDKRKELMIIYGEELESTGYSASDLQAGGKAHTEWPGLEKRLIERATKQVVIRSD